MQIFVHRYGTCLKASALGNKNTQIHPRIVQVLSRGLLKHKAVTHTRIVNSIRPGISSMATFIQSAEPSLTDSISLDAQRSKGVQASVHLELPNNRILASCS